MLRPTASHGRIFAFLAHVIVAGVFQSPAHARQSSPLEDASEMFETIKVENVRGNYPAAAKLTLTLVKTLRAEAQNTSNSGDRSTYILSACTALNEMLAARRCKEVLAERSAMRRGGLCLALSGDPPDQPAEVCEEAGAVIATPDPPQPDPPQPDPPQPNPGADALPSRPELPVVDTPPPPRHFRNTAIVTGAIGGVALLSSVVMGAVAARKDPTDCSPITGSYCKVYMAASTNGAVSESEHLCSKADRSADVALDQACSARDRLIVGTYATVALGSALGLSAIVTAVIHHVQTKRRPSKKGSSRSVSLQPVVGPLMMLQTTVRF